MGFELIGTTCKIMNWKIPVAATSGSAASGCHSRIATGLARDYVAAYTALYGTTSATVASPGAGSLEANMITAVTAWTALAKAKQVADNALAVATSYKSKIDVTKGSIDTSKSAADGTCTTATNDKNTAATNYTNDLASYNALVTTRDNAVLVDTQASADIVTGIAEIAEQLRVQTLANEDLTAAK